VSEKRSSAENFSEILIRGKKSNAWRFTRVIDIKKLQRKARSRSQNPVDGGHPKSNTKGEGKGNDVRKHREEWHGFRTQGYWLKKKREGTEKPHCLSLV